MSVRYFSDRDFTHYVLPFIFAFLLTFSLTSVTCTPHSSQWNAVSFFSLPFCHVMLLAFQLAVFSLGADVKFCINCWSTASGECSASPHHSGKNKCCWLLQLKLKWLSWFCIWIAFFILCFGCLFSLSPHHTISVFNFGSNVLILSRSVLLFLSSPSP